MKKLWLCFLLTLHMASIQGFLAFGSESPSFHDVKTPRTYSEQKIYVPYEHLKEVLDKKEKGIFIPYSDFIKLWEEVTRKPPETHLPPPPIDGAIINAEYRGTVYDDIAEFHGELKITALKKKWGKMLLNFEGLAVTSVSMDGAAPLLKPVTKGLELILPEKGVYTLRIDFSTRVQTIPGKKFVNFRVPSAPLTRIEMVIPGKDLDMELDPMLSKKSHVVGGNTHFSAFLPPEGNVNISWLAKSTEAKAASSLLFAKLSSELHVKESVYTFDTRIDFSVMQATADHFRIRIPEGLSLVRVKGQNIKDWEMGDDGILTVNLYEGIDGPYTLSVTTEKYRELTESTFDFPQFECVDAKREDGILVIKADPSLRVKVEKREKVTQIDPAEVTGQRAEEGLVSAFRYFRRPYLVRLAISKIQPKITAQQNILISFSETIIDYFSRVHFGVKDAGVFEFKFLVPDGFRVADVGTGTTVDNFSVTREKDRNLLKVTLKSKAYGDFSLPIRLEAHKEDKNLSLGVPKLICMGVEKEEGIIALSLRKNLKLSTSDVTSLRPISLEELRRMGMSNQDKNNVLAAGYRYSTPDYACTLDIEKRKSKVIAQVERHIDLEETVLKLMDVIRYNILYAPVSRFRVGLPRDVGKEAVITGENIKEKRFVTDGEEGKGYWLIELHGPQLDKYTLSVNLEMKLPEVKVGEKRTLSVPSLEVLNVFNETGHISISKGPNLQVEAEEDNLEPIDSKELPSTMNRGRSILAFKYLTHPYGLSLQSVKHDFEKVLDAIVNEAHFDIVVSREGIAKTEGVFRIQNTNRQSLEVLLPEGSENIYSVHISGQKASISRGSSDRSKIIMLGKNTKSGEEFTLRIVYQTKAGNDFGMLGGLRVESAEIMDVPMSKITWRLYLPDAFSYVYLKGSMEPPVDSFQMSKSLASRQVRSQRRINLANDKILQQSDEKALYGLDMDIVREGRLFTMSKLDKRAFVNVWYMEKNTLFVLSAGLVALVTIVFTLIILRARMDRAKVIMISLILLVFLRIVVPQGFKFFASLGLLGIGLSVCIFLGLHFYRREQSRNLLRAEDIQGE